MTDYSPFLKESNLIDGSWGWFQRIDATHTLKRSAGVS